MRILISGATGLLGRALVLAQRAAGHEVCRLVRGERSEPGDIHWDPASGRAPAAGVEGFDAAVCLSGAGIADAPWTESRKEVLVQSRVGSMGILSRALAQSARRPECLVCASATGYYGADRGAEVLTEDSPPGVDFLARLCTEWEAAARPAYEAGIRVVQLRFGVVLSAEGGALKRMLLPFRLGAGGRLGSGSQYFSWLSLEDAIGIVAHVIQTRAIEGAVNAVAPHPVTNAEFTRALGSALRRPAILCVPGIALRAAMGEASTLLLGSSRAYPRRLEASGYQFRHREIHEALRAAVAG